MNPEVPMPVATPKPASPWRSLLTPHGLLLRAGILVAVFAALHLAGLRKTTTVLCGMLPQTDKFAYVGAFFGLLYILFYIAVFVVVPILVLAAGFLYLFQRLFPPSHNTPAKDRVL